MNAALQAMIRGKAGAPDRLRVVRAMPGYPAGSLIVRRGNFSFLGNRMIPLHELIWLARLRAVVVEGVNHAAAA